MTPSSREPDPDQRERARQAWSLAVDEPASAEVLRVLRRILRVKRSELPQLTASLPGVVRRGARVDLAPLAEALGEAGLRYRLHRSERPS